MVGISGFIFYPNIFVPFVVDPSHSFKKLLKIEKIENKEEEE